MHIVLQSQKMKRAASTIVSAKPAAAAKSGASRAAGAVAASGKGFSATSAALPKAASSDAATAASSAAASKLSSATSPAVQSIEPLDIESLDAARIVLGSVKRPYAKEASWCLKDTRSDGAVYLYIPHMRLLRVKGAILQSRTFARANNGSRVVHSISYVAPDKSKLSDAVEAFREHVQSLIPVNEAGEFTAIVRPLTRESTNGDYAPTGNISVALTSGPVPGSVYYNFGLMRASDHARLGDAPLVPNDYTCFTAPADFEKHATTRAAAVVRVDIGRVPPAADAAPDAIPEYACTLQLVALYVKPEPTYAATSHTTMSIVLPPSAGSKRSRDEEDDSEQRMLHEAMVRGGAMPATQVPNSDEDLAML